VLKNDPRGWWSVSVVSGGRRSLVVRMRGSIPGWSGLRLCVACALCAAATAFGRVVLSCFSFDYPEGLRPGLYSAAATRLVSRRYAGSRFAWSEALRSSRPQAIPSRENRA
jgi:hypothetical protein